ncbi:Acylamino-acid-releasing enzyme [Pseudolycoriella hygida]|uniref:Acylamino-acid-releasing enzyme n=1 Tax=Pseudolycoriella hygida TaxID=35572 RepID=A0A9Q0MJZ9_9DIPT|nr:Acylamino-acid-releasing enzyme [Pseudolycoriella hygida]
MYGASIVKTGNSHAAFGNLGPTKPKKLVSMADSSSSTSSLDQDAIDSVVVDWVNITRTPTISGGYFTEDNNFFNISTLWSVMDFAKKDNVLFQRQFSVLKNSLNWSDQQDVLTADQLVMSSNEPVPITGKKICISQCGTRKAILVEKSDKTTSQKTQVLEIWGEQTLLKSYDLGELDKHKNIYTSGAFGSTMAWDKSAQNLAYLAEKKVAKAKPFFSSNVKVTIEEKEGDNEKKPVLKGEEYAFRQTWGEQLEDMYFSVIVVLNLESDKFELIELSDDDTKFPTDIQWASNTTIVGTSYDISEWRLGLYACNNRRSRIFRVDVDGQNLQFLSADGRAAFSPRVRPDGEYVIWQERAVDQPHNRSRDIMGMSLKDPKSPEVIYRSSTADVPIYFDFPRNCWIPNSSSVLLKAIKDGEMALFALLLTKDGADLQTIDDKTPGIRDLLWVGKDYSLISRSSTLKTPFFELIRHSGDHKRAQITSSTFSVGNCGRFEDFEVRKFYGKATVPSIYIGQKNSKPNTVPLIVMPHGGPHSVTVDAFVDELSLFLRQGFALLKLNYIGSLGSKTDETDMLLGKIGQLDVEDCHGIVQQALKSIPSLDSERIGLFGGSHGGFLSAHLSGQYPDFYKAAVLLNPVCDLNVMIGTSDIVDWCLAESGISFPDDTLKTFIPAAKNFDDFQKLYKSSPIVYASEVKAATLLLLGTEDLRVPMSQGMSFYRALKAYNKATSEVRVYPDCHSLMSPSVANDVALQSALWFKRFLKK